MITYTLFSSSVLKLIKKIEYTIIPNIGIGSFPTRSNITLKLTNKKIQYMLNFCIIFPEALSNNVNEKTYLHKHLKLNVEIKTNFDNKGISVGV